MLYDDLLARIDSSPNTLHALLRLDLLAGACRLDIWQMADIRNRLRRKAGMDESDWMHALETESARWSEKSFRASRRIASSDLLHDFARRHQDDFRSSKGISFLQGRALLCRLYVLSLHQLSARLGENGLKKRRIKELCTLFADDGTLAGCCSSIERPVVLAGKGRLKPTSDEFVFSVLVISQIVADLLCLSADPQKAGIRFAAMETLHAVRYMDQNALSAFLRPEGLPVAMEECAPSLQPALDGLEAVVDPAMVLFFADETLHSTAPASDSKLSSVRSDPAAL